MEENLKNENSMPFGEESIGSHEPNSEERSQSEDGEDERETVQRELDSKNRRG